MKKRIRTILEVAFDPRTTHSHQDCQEGLKTCKSLYDKGLPESQNTTWQQWEGKDTQIDCWGKSSAAQTDT